MRIIVLILVFVVSSCGLKYQDTSLVLCVKEGKHAFRPYGFSWTLKKEICYRWTPFESMVYNLGNTDQCDWLKLTGGSLSLFTNLKNSLMAGIRWDIEGYWIVAPYRHVNKERFIPHVNCSEYYPGGDDEHIKVYPGESFETHLKVSQNGLKASIAIVSSTDTLRFTQEFTSPSRRLREIYPWFGGTSKAPHSMCILREPINH